MQVHAYLNFDGRCAEALEFYKKALGAEVEMVMKYKDCPVPMDPKMTPPGSENKVMHASFKIGESTLMASDSHCMGKPEFKGISLSLPAPDEATANKLFKALSDGGKVQMPLTKTFFSPAFGIVNDRFGINWLVLVEQAK